MSQPLLAVASALLVLLAACQDNAPVPTAPSPVPSPLASIGTQSRDQLSNRLSSAPGACLVAVRSADGGYSSRSVAVALPKRIASSGAATARFAYRGWAPGVAEPVLLAVCTIPDAPSARAYFEKRFGGKPMSAAKLRSFAKSAGVAGVEEWAAWTSPQVMQGAGPAYLTDGLASESNATRAAPTDGVTAMMLEPCDPTAIIPELGCEGYVPEEEVVPAEPPPPDVAPEVAVVPQPSLSVSGPIYCEARTDYPHRSTTLGFVGRLNTKSSTSCPVPLASYITTALKRQKCFLWFFCSWPTIAAGANSGTSTFIQAIANTGCSWQTGWYRTEGFHQTVFPQGMGSTRTWSPVIGIRCW